MKRLSEQTLYEILEVRRDAPAGEVERAYERARALYGTNSLATYTLMEPEEAALLARRIEEARAVLLDPVMRAGYDAGLPPERPREVVRSRSLPPVVPPVRTAQTHAGPASQPVPLAAAVTTVSGGTSAPPAPPVLPSAPPVASVDLAPEPVPAAPNPIIEEVPVTPPPAAAAPPARPEPQRQAAPPIPSCAVPESGPWTGEALRRVREARGLTLREISERTKVTRYHLENIEADRYAQLPAAVYLRGILMTFSKELRLDGQKVARSYLEQVTAAQAVTQTPVKPR